GSLRSAQLCHDPSWNLSPALILYKEDRANHQITTEFDGSPVLVQVDSLGRHRKGALQAILPRQTYDRTEKHPTAPALCYRAATSVCRGQRAITMRFRVASRAFQAHAHCKDIRYGGDATPQRTDVTNV